MWEILYYMTEIFELAARLALGPARDDWMAVSARLAQLGRRGLVVGQSTRVEFSAPYGPPPNQIDMEVVLPRDRLVAEGRNEAVALAREFFLRFGWRPSVEQLSAHQEELIKVFG